jgi:hypothetical protein
MKLKLVLMSMALLLFTSVAASGAGMLTGPNGTVERGSSVTFTTGWAGGFITLRCTQGPEVLNVTQKYNTAFLLDSPTWGSAAASCSALWYTVKNGTPTTQNQIAFAVPASEGEPPPPPSDNPLVMVIYENRSFSAIAGHAPYLNGLAAQGRLFTNERAITHPSLPNYMALTAGSTLGCVTDVACTPNTLNAENFYHQLEVAGVSWGTYSENMTVNCGLKDTGTKPDKYVAHHNAVVYFTNVHEACLQKSRPLSQLDVNALADFTNIEVTNRHNMHDGTLAEGDAWAAANFPALLNAGATILFTFDEGCCSQGQNVYTFIVGPGITPSVNNNTYTHYGVLAALEDHFGLSRIGSAVGAVPLPIEEG